MVMRPERIGLSAALALHGLAAVFLLSYEPARKALLAAAPIMVDLITPPPVIEPPKPLPPRSLPSIEPPKPKPVMKNLTKVPVQRPIDVPLLTVPAQAPSPVAVAPAPPSAVEVAGVPGPALTQPIYSADYLENPSPPYPTQSRRQGEEGRVILRVLVNPRGTADEVQVRTSSGFARLDDSARETVRRWKFVPAKRGSEPVQAWVLIPISFRLEG